MTGPRLRAAFPSFALPLAALLAVAAIIAAAIYLPASNRGSIEPTHAAAVGVLSPFSYLFKVPGVLHESDAMEHSTSQYWWVNSGGMLIISGGFGETVQNALPPSDRWRKLYAENDPIDTDEGARPQNIFRLVSRSIWDSARIEASFFIARDNLSSSPNRNESNGLLLFSRYASSDTLYYAGIRVDGTAVIKKKYLGTYYTMAQNKIFPGSYSLSARPNLLPHEKWLRLRVDTATLEDGSVSIQLSMQDAAGTSTWKQIASARDNGITYGRTPPITGSHFIGIRTDFMDVKFKDFLAKDL